MQRVYFLAITSVILAIFLGVGFLSAPLFPADERPFIAQIAAISALYTGGAILFLLALKGFKQHLRTAYKVICASMLVLVAGMLQYPVFVAFNAFDSWWVQNYFFNLPFTLTIILSYLGVRIIVKILNVQSSLVNLWVGLGLALGVGLVYAVLPIIWNVNDIPKEIDYRWIIDGFATALLAISAVLVYKARKVASDLYKPALFWLLLWNALAALAHFLPTIAELYIPYDHWYHELSIDYIPYIIVGIFSILSALHFNRIAHAEQTTAPKNSKATSVDVIVCLAGFVSNPAPIDPILDDLRGVTSKMKAGDKLDESQQSILAKVYLRVEEFLVTKEPARKYAMKDLREMVELRYKDTVNEPTFWQGIASDSSRS